MAMSFLVAFGLFFLQPVFLVGLLLAVSTGRRRIKLERNNHRSAIYRSYYEVKEYMMPGLAFGVIGSVIFSIIGVPVTLDWIILYQLTVLLLLLFGYRFIHPMFSFSIAALGLVGSSLLGFGPNSFSFLPDTWYRPLSQMAFLEPTLLTNILFFTVFLLSATCFLMRRHTANHLTPYFFTTKRGKRTARYRMKPLWMVPLLLVIPGESFTSFFDWWPVFTMGSQSYSFFWLPVLVGFRYTVQAQLPQEAGEKIAKELGALTIAASIVSLISIWVPYAVWGGFSILLVGGLLVLYRHRLREKKKSLLFGPEAEGLKVIGIRPDTPAEKMELKVGDTIVVCNERSVKHEDDFYHAVMLNSVYCRLKVKGPDGELRLTETAIYADSPHELGVVFLLAS